MRSLTLLADPAISHALRAKLLSNSSRRSWRACRAMGTSSARSGSSAGGRWLRIGLRDLMGKADLHLETVGELSDLAEVCLQTAYEHVNADLQRSSGRPLAPAPDGTAGPRGSVIAMWQLGGRVAELQLRHRPHVRLYRRRRDGVALKLRKARQ